MTDLSKPWPQTTVNYVCGGCSARGVKLWRGVHGCRIRDQRGGDKTAELLCRPCVVQWRAVDIAEYTSLGIDGGDQIGGLLPAVPIDDTYWGYSSVPQEWCDWWNALPDVEGSDTDGR